MTHVNRVVTVWFRNHNSDWDTFYYVYMSDGTEYKTYTWSAEFGAPGVIQESDTQR